MKKETHLESQNIHVTARMIDWESKLNDVEEKIVCLLSNSISDSLDIFILVNIL